MVSGRVSAPYYENCQMTERITSMDQKVKENYIINDIENVKMYIEDLTKYEINIESMINFIETEKRTDFCFSAILQTREPKDKDATIVWLDSGYVTPKGEAIFISLKKSVTNEEPYYIYAGYYVGTAGYLSKGIRDHNQAYAGTIKENFERFKSKYYKKIEQRNIKHLESNSLNIQEITTLKNEEEIEDINTNIIKNDVELVDEIYDKLLYPMFNSKSGLERYIKILGKRITQLVNDNWDVHETDSYVMNEIKSVIVNSGLINKMGLDYMIQYRYHVGQKMYIAYNLVESKRDYIKYKYTREQAMKKLKPIMFVDDSSQEILNATMDDFDISQRSLLHIIKERRERFPEEIQDEDSELIARYLFSAVERGIKILRRDPSYIKPTYSGETGTISWYMPFHIKRKFTEEPELVIVIRKVDEFFEIKTILPYDDEIKDRITALALYSKIW